jgi:hypothetical protein
MSAASNKTAIETCYSALIADGTITNAQKAQVVSLSRLLLVAVGGPTVTSAVIPNDASNV